LSLWDAATGRLKQEAFQKIEPRLVAFSCDGKKLAVATHRYGIRIRDPEVRGDAILEASDRHRARAMVFSPDSRKVVELGGPAFVWDVGREQVEHRLYDPSEKLVQAAAFSPDGRLLACAGEGVRLWDLGTGKRVGDLEGYEGDVVGVAFSADGKVLVSACEDRSLRFWDVAKRRLIRRVPTERILVFACSPDGKVLATSGHADTVQLWDAVDGSLLREISNGAYADCLAFSPDGKKLVTGGQCHALRMWDVQTGQEAHPFEAHRNEVVAVAFSPDGGTLATLDAAQTARLWDSVTGKPLHRLQFGDFFQGHGAVRDYYPATPLAFTPDGKHLAATSPAAGSGLRFAVHVFDAALREKCATLDDPRGSHIDTFALAPDNDTVAVPAKGGALLWSICTRKKIRLISNNQRSIGRPVTDAAVAFSSDGRTLATSGIDGIRFWNWQQGTVRRSIPGDWPSASFLAFSPDGKILAACQNMKVADPDTKVYLWEVASGTLVRSIDAHGGLNALAFSPDGSLLATAPFKDKTVRVWSVFSGKEVTAFEGHAGAICSVAFSPDGKRLASGSTDTTALVWSLDGVAAPLPRTDPGPKDLGALWSRLADSEARTAYPALWSLAGAGDKAVAFLAERVAPAPSLDAKRIGELLAALDSDDFPTRQDAAEQLVLLGRPAIPAVRKALEGKPSVDLRKRLQTLLDDLSNGPAPADLLRRVRAVTVLETVGSEKARELLKKLAAGADHDDATLDARAALRRLERRARQP
jgi:WD40 repeat protein